jgi:hypothetical protein
MFPSEGMKKIRQSPYGVPEKSGRVTCSTYDDTHFAVRVHSFLTKSFPQVSRENLLALLLLAGL